ncbi:hypothetical protein RB2083_2160 [Rhodobacteraceae bacterium HTCC2083]|nr:hypothetical protein RB2083_2160 [Rhodobacteraceae bacterium HTCC2083]
MVAAITPVPIAAVVRMAIFYLFMCAKQKRFHEDDEQGSAQSTVCEIFS